MSIYVYPNRTPVLFYRSQPSSEQSSAKASDDSSASDCRGASASTLPLRPLGHPFFTPGTSPWAGGRQSKNEAQAIPYDRSTATYYPDGGFKIIELLSDFDIQDIPCANKSEVVFYPSGAVRGAFLARTHYFPSVDTTFPEGTPVNFREDGSLLSVYLLKGQFIQGRSYPKSTTIYFDENGRARPSKVPGQSKPPQKDDDHSQPRNNA